MTIVSYKDLIVWRKSIDLVEEIYKTTQKFPVEEKYGLTSQMRRSAVSISSNIAEGRLKSTRREFRYFLFISLGSAAELETQIHIAERIFSRKSFDFSTAKNLLEEIMKMLNVLISRLAPKLKPKT